MYYKLLFHNPWKVENGKNMSFRPFWHNTVDKQKFGGTLISVSAAPYLGVTCPVTSIIQASVWASCINISDNWLSVEEQS